MITDALYLWRHRERPATVKRRLILIVKRFRQLVPLITLLLGAHRARRRGARIGHLVILGKSRIGGEFGRLSIGDESSLGRCDIALHDEVCIGKRCVINDGAVLLTASHALDDPKWRHTRAPIQIGDYAWIATNAILLPGTTLGRGAVVGAGAVVRGAVPDYAVVSGNPARVHSTRRNTDLDYSPVMLNAPFQAWVGRLD